jgi:hypothetical protein
VRGEKEAFLRKKVGIRKEKLGVRKAELEKRIGYELSVTSYWL